MIRTTQTRYNFNKNKNSSCLYPSENPVLPFGRGEVIAPGLGTAALFERMIVIL